MRSEGGEGVVYEKFDGRGVNSGNDTEGRWKEYFV